MNDPYRTLNLGRNADAAAIKSAYRKLAKELHPDRNPGDGRAEQRFREATQAYELLSDPEKRAAYDRGLIDGEGKPRGGFGFGFGGGPGVQQEARARGFESIFERAFGGGFARGFGGGSQNDANGVFEELLRGRSERSAGGGPSARPLRGTDIRHRLEVDFLTAVRGGRERVALRAGRTLEVDIPPGTADGQVLRLRRQGQTSPSGGEAGDALIEIAVRPHPRFERKGDDIHLELPISLSEAVLGAKVKVPTIDSAVRVAIAPGANSGQTLRLRGKGVARADGSRGDQYVRLMVMLPERPDQDMAALLQRLAAEHTYEVRRDLEPA